MSRAVELDAAPGAAPRPPATERLWRALEEVNDPELPISLVDLGLVYDVRWAGPGPDSGAVIVELTFTAMGCPCVAFIKQDVRDRLLEEPGVRDVRIEEVWHPAWSRARMTEKGRALMRGFGVTA